MEDLAALLDQAAANPQAARQAQAKLLLQQLEEQKAKEAGAKKLAEDALFAEVQNVSAANQGKIAPLAAAMDGVFGTKVSGAIAGQEAARKDPYGRADDLLDNLIETKKASMTQLPKLLGDSAKEDRLSGQFADNMLFKKEEALGKDLDKDILDPVNTRAQQFEAIDQAFAMGDYQSIGNALSNFARGVSGEKGVLTDQDIARIMPRNIFGDVAKIKSYFASTPTEQMKPEYIAKLRELVKLAKQNSKTVYTDWTKNKAASYKGRGSYRGLERNVDTAAGFALDRINQAFGSAQPQAPAPKAAAPAKSKQAAVSGLSPEEAAELAALEAQFGGKK